MKEISVCIVDDNRDLRNALEEIISMSEGYNCIGTIGTAQEAIANTSESETGRCIDGYKPGKQ